MQKPNILERMEEMASNECFKLHLTVYIPPQITLIQRQAMDFTQ